MDILRPEPPIRLQERGEVEVEEARDDAQTAFVPHPEDAWAAWSKRIRAQRLYCPGFRVLVERLRIDQCAIEIKQCGGEVACGPQFHAPP